MLKTKKEKEKTIRSSSTKTQQERTWVKMAKDGSREAFEQLASHYYGDIFRMIYYRTQRRMDAEDLTQEVFLKAYKSLGSLADENHFKGWLFRIAVNRVRDFHRRKKFSHLFKNIPNDEVDAHVDTHAQTESGPLEALIRKRFLQESEMFLSKLSRMEKDVFILRFTDQLQINEIATALQKGESTIKTHLYRALSKFKKDRAFQDFLKGV
jgi:RNA polymerase sigma-70 factor (ECF subfamily)